MSDRSDAVKNAVAMVIGAFSKRPLEKGREHTPRENAMAPRPSPEGAPASISSAFHPLRSIGAHLRLEKGLAVTLLLALALLAPSLALAEEGKEPPHFPLDPESPWPKFRGNVEQTGRSPLKPRVDEAARPWTFQTGKGVFSSPVVDAEGTVYIGSADHSFYAIDSQGKLRWTYRTGEIIDSSALLDDRGRVYVGSGDGHVYAFDRNSGELIWKFRAHTPSEVSEEFDLETYNVNWFEGNIAMLPDGHLLAPNDNRLVYVLERDTGARVTQFLANEMVWSLPAVNGESGMLFFGTTSPALKTTFGVDSLTGEQKWRRGGLGSAASSPLLTRLDGRDVVIIGSFDGFLRAYDQKSGKRVWKHGFRDHLYSSPAQLSSGLLIQPSADGSIYALDPKDGSLRWAFDTLEPIRSSPAVDGNDTIYVGTGDGQLLALNPDGTLRWAYQCIEGPRDDLNASPALGPQGITIAGESGGVFFIPYDYPLTPSGRADPRCKTEGGEGLPDEGAFLVYTSPFGELMLEAPEPLPGNQPLTFSLLLRHQGNTEMALLDPSSLRVEVSSGAAYQVLASANRQFVSLIPQETWTGPEGGPLEVKISAPFRVSPRRLGLKRFWGKKGGKVQASFNFAVPPQPAKVQASSTPWREPPLIFEFKRLSAPLPDMLPSWNQIGFDSLHYLAGEVEERNGKFLLLVVGAKQQEGKTVVDPTLQVRFPLMLEVAGDLLTFYNYDGFKINFIGSWDMPFGLYRIALSADPETLRPTSAGALSAVAHCDEIKFYGRGLKWMGLSDFRNGHMPVAGGLEVALWEPESVEEHQFPARSVAFSLEQNAVIARLTGSTIRASEHVVSLLLVDSKSGAPLPLFYTRDTRVSSDAEGRVTEVRVDLGKVRYHGVIEALLVVDAFGSVTGKVISK